MPNNKNFTLRILILDRMLRTNEGSDINEMLDAVNDYLQERGFPAVKSKVTLHNDMGEISNTYHVNIISRKGCPDARRIKYRYEDISFSIFNNRFSARHIRDIREALSFLSCFRGIPGFDWMDEMLSRFDVAMEPDAAKVVQFEESYRKLGMEHFSPLFHAIRSRTPVSVTYRHFDKTTRTVTLSPYFLKQYSRRWYLLAHSPRRSGVSTFCLDRIKSMCEDEDGIYTPIDLDIDSYYKDVYGITRVSGVQPVTIRFYVSRKDFPYLNTCPIHQSQTVRRKNYAGAIMSIHVIPNTELMMRFLSYGDGVVVLTDIPMRHEIIRKLKKMLKMYESFK